MGERRFDEVGWYSYRGLEETRERYKTMETSSYGKQRAGLSPGASKRAGDVDGGTATSQVYPRVRESFVATALSLRPQSA